MSAPNRAAPRARRRRRGDPASGIVISRRRVSAVGSVAGAVHLGPCWPATRQQAARPTRLSWSSAWLAQGTVAWPAATGVLIGLRRPDRPGGGRSGGPCGAAHGGKRSRVDGAARHMGRGRDLDALSQRGATATAERLGVKGSPGVPVGQTVLGGQLRCTAPGRTCTSTSGGPARARPRRGRSRRSWTRPGAVLVTSNKRDIVDAHPRRPRRRRARCGCSTRRPSPWRNRTWWWNPLSYVTDEVTAGTPGRALRRRLPRPGRQDGRLLRPRRPGSPRRPAARRRPRRPARSPRSTPG